MNDKKESVELTEAFHQIWSNDLILNTRGGINATLIIKRFLEGKRKWQVDWLTVNYHKNLLIQALREWIWEPRVQIAEVEDFVANATEKDAEFGAVGISRLCAADVGRDGGMISLRGIEGMDVSIVLLPAKTGYKVLVFSKRGDEPILDINKWRKNPTGDEAGWVVPAITPDAIKKIAYIARLMEEALK